MDHDLCLKLILWAHIYLFLLLDTGFSSTISATECQWVVWKWMRVERTVTNHHFNGRSKPIISLSSFRFPDCPLITEMAKGGHFLLIRIFRSNKSETGFGPNLVKFAENSPLNWLLSHICGQHKKSTVEYKREIIFNI